jgi:class 3 adenylate cyclase
VTEAAARPVAALHLELHDLDVWAQKASPADIKGRLDRFCNAIALRAKANGGRVEQVLGHAHLVSFANDANSVRAALRCGLEVSALLKDVGVVCGLHVGNEVSGFFGEGESATRVEVGEAPGMARALAPLAHAPTFYATDAVNKIVGQDPAFRLTMMGPARTHLGNTMLFSVETAEGEGA